MKEIIRAMLNTVQRNNPNSLTSFLAKNGYRAPRKYDAVVQNWNLTCFLRDVIEKWGKEEMYQLTKWFEQFNFFEYGTVSKLKEAIEIHFNNKVQTKNTRNKPKTNQQDKVIPVINITIDRDVQTSSLNSSAKQIRGDINKLQTIELSSSNESDHLKEAPNEQSKQVNSPQQHQLSRQNNNATSKETSDYVQLSSSTDEDIHIQLPPELLTTAEAKLQNRLLKQQQKIADLQRTLIAKAAQFNEQSARFHQLQEDYGDLFSVVQQMQCHQLGLTINETEQKDQDDKITQHKNCQQSITFNNQENDYQILLLTEVETLKRSLITKQIEMSNGQKNNEAINKIMSQEQPHYLSSNEQQQIENIALRAEANKIKSIMETQQQIIINYEKIHNEEVNKFLGKIDQQTVAIEKLNTINKELQSLFARKLDNNE